MKAACRALRLLALLWAGLAAAAALAQTAVPLPAMSAPDEDALREVLVMLHLPKPHYRPDSSYASTYGDGVGLQARQRVAAALASLHRLEVLSEWPMPLAGVDCYVMRLPAADTREPEQVAQALTLDARVVWAQPVHVYRARATRDEPLYATQPAARQWRLAELHELASGRGVRVAVIDSGIEATHPDLAGQLLLNQNFVDGRPLVGESHGTAVAGIIAARADNGLGIAGIAPQARLLGLRACWQGAGADTLCTSLGLAKALQAAVQHGAQVINLSLAGPDDRLLGLLLDQAMARGVAVVAALGGGRDRFPASHPGVLAVGGTPPLPAGALLAPGTDVPSTAPAGGWTLVSGSSFAAAHVSGLLALMRELDLGGSGQVRAALVTDAAGRIDACATLLPGPAMPRRACALPGLGQTSE